MRFAALLLAAASAWGGETIRVGVFSLFQPQRLVVKPAPGAVLRVEIDGRESFLEGARNAAFRRVGDGMDCFLRRELTPARRARVSARDGGAAEFVLSVPGRIERRFRGTLEIASRAGALQAVVTMDLETAVAAVVAAESPPDAPLEARKAQAVVARSFYRATRGRHSGYDFCDTTHCQFLRDAVADQAPAVQTAGLILTWQGKIVGALYSAACGGRTRTLAEIGLPTQDYPFFAADCVACRRDAAQWTARFSGDDAARLAARPYSETVRLSIVRRLGWKALPGNNYELAREGDAVVLRGRGAGHGVGLCQHGAAALAKAGLGFRAILNRYFPAVCVQSAPMLPCGYDVAVPKGT
jgi:stage II sporulation protein D